jgi:hypothetical protein
MKKIICLFLGIISFMLFGINVSAASKCDYTELAEINQEAAGVKVSYEEKKRVLEGDNGVADTETGELEGDVYERYFTVNITNVTDNLYIKVINSYDNSTKVMSSSDAVNGVISFDWHDIDQIAKLTVKVYTSAKTNCADEEIMVQYKTLPMYNYYSDSQYCEENPKVDVCQQYVTNEITEEEYYKQVDQTVSSGEEEKEEKNVVKKVTNYFKKNKKQVIIGGSIIIVVGVVTTVVVIVKRRRSRLI